MGAWKTVLETGLARVLGVPHTKIEDGIAKFVACYLGYHGTRAAHGACSSRFGAKHQA